MDFKKGLLIVGSIVVVIVLLAITLVSALAYDSETITYTNESALPLHGVLLFTLNGQPNGTAFITQQQFNTNVELTFPNSVYFGDNSTVTLPIDYDIHNFVVPEESILLNTSIIITNNFNNGSSELGILFNVSRTTTINISSIEQFTILTEGYQVSISNNLLPKFGSFDFLLKGEEGSIVKITNCGIWLSCPNETLMNTKEKTITIPYNIPTGTTSGVYNMSFLATNDLTNVTDVGLVNFNIFTANITLQKFPTYEDCYPTSKTKEELELCIKKVDDAINEAREKALRDIFAQANNLNNTVIKEVEKLVMVGSVDEELKANLETCNQNLAKTQEEFTQCSDKNNGLIEEKSKYDEFMNQQGQLNEESKQKLNESAQQELAKQKKRNYLILGIIAGVLMLGGIFAWYKITYEKNNHSKL